LAVGQCKKGEDMKKTSDTIDNRRRKFLKLAATAAPAAAATVALTGTEAAAVELEAEGSGLQDTAQIRAYYESARF